ncbi:MAG: TIGR03560 family F420-dependent LLM class oxidoreductase [Acidimicrobiales bacterium]|nr:TIGR03560 family F420-dependent LLM class oxidoreductase [Acidimicrobiales bacterium]
MDIRVFVEPQQGTTYSELLALALHAETLGFDGFFSSDHLLKMGDSISGLPGPLHTWTTLAGLARDTERLRLGSLVSPMTLHHPAQLAIAVAQVDEMSGGRIELGVGAGWYEAEHVAHGLAFPPVSERFDRLAESLAIISGMWATPESETFSFEGNHFTIAESPSLPKPYQRPAPPLIIGGRGRRRTPSLAAQYAREFNLGFPESPVDWRAGCDNVAEYCEARERDPETMIWSTVLVAATGTTEADFARRAAAIGREPSELRGVGAAGLVDEFAERIAAFDEVGCDRMYLQVLDVKDLDHLSVMADALNLDV